MKHRISWIEDFILRAIVGALILYMGIKAVDFFGTRYTIHESVSTREIKCFDIEMQPIDCSCINIKTERYNHVWVE